MSQILCDWQTASKADFLQSRVLSNFIVPRGSHGRLP
jgi:hypothetical protein